MSSPSGISPGESINWGKPTIPYSEVAPDPRLHLAHCFDYIAQAIICASDDTIEPPEVWIDKNGEKKSVVNGIGHTHHCRSPALIWEMVEKSKEKAYETQLTSSESAKAITTASSAQLREESFKAVYEGIHDH
ncbi:hypothetical protein BDZ45DRAFT_747612 [Acephala macrosclerotiorum]|nr:hypothetical protein BDZ45DRAFT_747612 [Acephala macrosclerotiorum]